MPNQLTYFIILACSFAGPLLLSFDRKVAFYKSWRFVFPSMLLPAVLYIAWDVFFTSIHVWSFNEHYISGIKLFNLPIEEVLFFFIVPYCCTFIYACMRVYLPGIIGKTWGWKAIAILAFVCGLIGLIFHKNYYTGWTFLLTAIIIAIAYWLRNYFEGFDPSSFLLSYLVVLIPFLIVNGFLTAIPVVLYNDAENLGIRIYTIPVEDSVYGMLLFLLNILGYERRKSISLKRAYVK